MWTGNTIDLRWVLPVVGLFVIPAFVGIKEMNKVHGIDSKGENRSNGNGFLSRNVESVEIMPVKEEAIGLVKSEEN